MIRPRVFRMGRVIPRSRLRPLGPVGLLGAVAAGILLAVAAVFTLGLALLLRPRVRPGRPRGADAPGGGAPAGDGATPRRDAAGAGATAASAAAGTGATDGERASAPRRERSYAEVIEAWPIVAAL